MKQSSAAAAESAFSAFDRERQNGMLTVASAESAALRHDCGNSGGKAEGTFSAFDRQCMKRAFSLARRGEGRTSPNPLVGAVVARGGRILGEGWHRSYGDKHAEREALDAVLAAGLSPAGSDLYCTLEPCCFTGHGKHQPPCTELIVGSGVRRVFIANRDPHPAVNGEGVRALQAAGISVQSGLFAEKGEELNEAFFSFQRRGRPFVQLKIAQTLDGKIAALNGNARWITDESARQEVHRLRGRSDAVLVGRGTVLADDPELTVRLAKGRNPVRAVLDSRLSLPNSAKLLSLPDREKTLIVCAADADAGRMQRLRDRGVTVLPVAAPPGSSGSPAGLPLALVLAALGERGIRSVLVEGGRGIFSSFLKEGLWDKLSVFIAPRIMGDGIPAVSGFAAETVQKAIRLGAVSTRRIGDQLLFEGFHVYRDH
jgi:diaminohydroxyphosphoribosylaminopyrimidine deaminase/5-amino-6-(5-phosphoribosylamino)uracil reductase